MGPDAATETSTDDAEIAAPPVADDVVTEEPVVDAAAPGDESAASPAPAEATPDPVLVAVERMEAAVVALQERVRADQDIISRMQARIEAMQGDQVRALLGPLVTELANLQASFAEAAGRDYERLGFERVRKEFDLLGDRIEAALDVVGAISLEAEPGVAFNSRIHSAVRQVPTTDPAQDKTIAAVSRQGFTFDPAGKPALYARVVVYGYAPETPDVAEPADTRTETASTPEPVAPAADDTELRVPFAPETE